MTDALKKIIEGIDNRDISAVAEHFEAAIKEKVFVKLAEEAKKAFDKGVEKIEGDGESDADGEDESEDKKKISEAVKLGKEQTLAFNAQVTLNSAEKKNPSSMSGDVYDAIAAKFGKGQGTITNKDDAIAKNKVAVNIGKKNLSISVVGGGKYVRIVNTDSALGAKADSKYLEIK